MGKKKRLLESIDLEIHGYTNILRKFRGLNVVDSNVIDYIQKIVAAIKKATQKATTFQQDISDSEMIDDVLFKTFSKFVGMVSACDLCIPNRVLSTGEIFGHLCAGRHSRANNKQLQYLKGKYAKEVATFMVKQKKVFDEANFNVDFRDIIMEFYIVSHEFLLNLEKFNKWHVVSDNARMSTMRALLELLKEINTFFDIRPVCLNSVPGISKLITNGKYITVRFVFNQKQYDNSFTLLDHLRDCSWKLPSNIQEFQYNQFKQMSLNQMAVRFPQLIRPNTVPQQLALPIPQNIQRALPPVNPSPSPPMYFYRSQIIPQPVPGIQYQAKQMIIMPPRQPVFQQQPVQIYQPMPTLPTPPHQHPLVGQPIVSRTAATKKPNTKNIVLPANMKEFLKNPDLTELIENGTIMVEFPKYSIIPKQLEEHLKDKFPNVKITPYGARISGVGYESDSVHFYIDSGESSRDFKNIIALIQSLSEMFNDNKSEWEVLQKEVKYGLKSFISVKNKIENVNCVITFDTGLNSSNTKLIQYFVNLQPMSQKLCYLVQEWCNRIALTMPRLVIIELVIFYMQIQNFLPSVQSILKGADKEYIGDWQCNFNEQSLVELGLQLCTDFDELTIKFFKFYGEEFNFDQNIVCPYLGMPLERRAFETAEIEEFPIKAYKEFIQRKSTRDGRSFFDHKAELCIQDFLELNENIAKEIKNSNFIILCQISYAILQGD